MISEFKQHLPDPDPGETQEWIDSVDYVVNHEGKARAQFVLRKMLKRAD